MLKSTLRNGLHVSLGSTQSSIKKFNASCSVQMLKGIYQITAKTLGPGGGESIPRTETLGVCGTASRKMIWWGFLHYGGAPLIRDQSPRPVFLDFHDNKHLQSG